MTHSEISGALEGLQGRDNGTPIAFSQFDELARRAIECFVARPELTDAIQATGEPGTYVRNLLFASEKMSAWTIVWGRGSKTAIHDHHCHCCFGVLRGELTELQFKPIGEYNVLKTGKLVCKPGHIASMTPTGSNIHQMINHSDSLAVSLHIYNFTPQLYASSIHREYRLRPV